MKAFVISNARHCTTGSYVYGSTVQNASTLSSPTDSSLSSGEKEHDKLKSLAEVSEVNDSTSLALKSPDDARPSASLPRSLQNSVSVRSFDDVT